MPIEKEIGLKVDVVNMPVLEHYPSVEIEQTYLTPVVANPMYPETASAEWRVRKITDRVGRHTYSTALKLGDKISGSRIEVEADIEPGAFGTGKERLDFAFGELKKIRYDLGNGLIVDRYLDSLQGDEYQAEKEFKEDERQDHWGCPEWLTPDPAQLSNRKRARPVEPKYGNGLYGSTISESELLESIAKTRQPAIVTVSGMSGSGKSTIAKSLSDKLQAVHIDTDMLHVGVTELLRRYGIANHDLVGTYDYVRGADAALDLASGRSTKLPIYDYLTGEPTGSFREYAPAANNNVVVDGLYASETAKYLRNDSSFEGNILAVLVDTPLYVSLIRRMLRDCAIDSNSRAVEREVAFSPEGSLRYLAEMAIPSYINADFYRDFDYIAARSSE